MLQRIRLRTKVSQVVEDLESYAEPGMRATLTGGKMSHETLILDVNYAPFDEFNRAFEPKNYYDKSGAPTLTAREANPYKPQD